MSEGGEVSSQTNINHFLEEFGIVFNQGTLLISNLLLFYPRLVIIISRAKNPIFLVSVLSDAVIRTIFHKYFEPKEALIFDGILNRAISQAAGAVSSNADDNNNSQSVRLFYFVKRNCSLNTPNNTV